MRRAQVVVGHVYLVKVSGKLAPVRVTEDLGKVVVCVGCMARTKTRHRGWEGVNTRTGRKVHIRSAAKLREEVTEVAL